MLDSLPNDKDFNLPRKCNISEYVCVCEENIKIYKVKFGSLQEKIDKFIFIMEDLYASF